MPTPPSPANLPLPPLACPFETGCHPLAHDAHEAAVQWAQRFGLVSSARGLARLRGSRISWLVARAFPTARPNALQIAADWTTLFCLLDDHCEGLSTLEHAALLSPALEAFRAGVTSSAEPISLALVDLHTRMSAAGATDTWIARFAARLEELVIGFVWESTHRATGSSPDLASYLRLREITVGLHPQFELLALTNGITLPDAVLDHPTLARMRAVTARVVGLENDVFTCEREMQEGEIHNAVLVTVSREGCSLPEALERVRQLHDNAVAEFLRLECALPSFPAHAPEVRAYVSMLRAWMAGHLEWARETGRYRPSPVPTVSDVAPLPPANSAPRPLALAPLSRLAGFYRRSVDDRRSIVARVVNRALPDLAHALDHGGLSVVTADKTVENVLGTYALPFALGLNVRINGRDRLVPMVVEEPSVVAAMSHAAKWVREGGGFRADHDPPLMVAQVQLWDVTDPEGATERLLAEQSSLLELANTVVPGLVSRGGGAVQLQPRDLGDGLFVVHVVVNVCDAMGANLVNAVAERVAPRILALTGGTLGLRILSNLADARCVRVQCTVPVECLATKESTGPHVRDGIVRASHFAARDPYRAATHNKGVMNGVDAVVMATGNDWRAVEAGAHAFAARSGRYTSLTTWSVNEDGALVGSIEMPLALGIVGGTLRVHPTAQLALEILDVESAQELAEVAAAAGLASNLAALRALASEGIQRGHMSLHARSVAVAAGAQAEDVERIAALLSTSSDVSLRRATEFVAALRSA